MRTAVPIVAAAVVALLVPTGPSAFAAPPVAAAPAAVAQPVVAQPAGATVVSEVTAAVTRRLLTTTAAEGRRPVVTVSRQADGWAFGTAVLAGRPGGELLPEGWLFLAKRSGEGVDRWLLAFEGDATFAELVEAAPTTVTSDTERPLLAAQGRPTAGTQAGSDYRTGMQFPWSVGAYWVMSGGPHGWGGSDLPYSSLDLHGGDQVVRAARAGAAYTMCRGWIRVIHDRGDATDYYHLWNNINVNGASVGAGTRLGDTGTDVTCGGAANGRHVHFGLRQNGVYVGIGGHNVGGWVPIAGAAYGGYALRGSYAAYPGAAPYNYGALGFNQGVIDSNGGGAVNRRTGPGTNYGLAGTVNDGTTVTISCSANGTTHAGRWGTTSLWNRLSDGTWVTDAFMWTGVSGPATGYC